MSALMVQGVSSWAGKSLLATALCRSFARQGVRVAPFKGQNMSNNARVVAGGEIGAAQYLQALAARIEPTVEMNPVLVKPEGDNRSQVIVRGRPDLELSRRRWTERPPALWPVIEDSFQRLLGEYELVVIEGAGSPAEINLRRSDLANMRLATLAQAPVILVADIERGGAFAHLYGTWALLEPGEQRLLRAFVLNKFRGDQALLADGPARLEELTGVPLAGVLPWLAHGLPDEDGAAQPTAAGGRPTVAVVRYPTASNLDEFKALEAAADVRFATRPEELDRTDLVILPGSKHVAADLDWLRTSGLAEAVTARARQGAKLLAICGGLQMLGESIDGEAGIDGSGRGLGLLPLRTVFAPEKITRSTRARFAGLAEPWAALSGLAIEGYEIRHGRTQLTGTPTAALPGGLGFQAGSVLAVYLHGLFEQAHVVDALFASSGAAPLDAVFDRLADAIEAHLDTGLIRDLAGVS